MTSRTAEEIGRTATGPRPVPALVPGARGKVPTVGRAVLDNGLTVLAVRKPRSPLVEVRLRVPLAGPSRVHAARAELLAATLLLGTEQRDRRQVDADLAVVGGHLDASVDPQRLLITGSVLASGLPRLLEVLADSLTGAAYRKDVPGERPRWSSIWPSPPPSQAPVAHRLLQDRRFGDHPAAWDIPDAELVAAVGPAAVRGLHARAVVPRGATLTLVGDLSPSRTLATAAQALDGWASERSVRTLTPPPAIVGDRVLAVHRPGAVQSQVRLSGPAVTRSDPAYPAHQLANLVYGGYFSSRLVENLREDKGFTYHARSSLEFWPERAAVSVSFDTTTDATAPALLEAQYELGRLSLQPPTEQEVESARNYALGTLATSLATQAGLASMLSMLAGSGLDENWLREHPVRLAATTVDEVARAAAGMLAPAAFTGVVLGDLDAVAPGLRGLGTVIVP
ncbi:MAG: insulinase family protein [Nakamurella multipartita]